MKNADVISSIPVVSGLDHLKNPKLFVERFHDLTDNEWSAVLLKSATDEEIDGVRFPRFPDQETQRRIHGATMPATSIREAIAFYNFAKNHSEGAVASGEINFLDFGSGWGRMSRPYLKDLPFNRIYSYEPNLGYCVLQRILNPYIAVLNGCYLPDGILPARFFDLIVGWSVFSHLSENYAVAWLKEFARNLRPGGKCILTTWGLRFLHRLMREEEALNRGESIDWYSNLCIKAAGGNLEGAIRSFEQGNFVWFGSPSSGYGEAFIPKACLEGWIDRYGIELKIELFDEENLPQDCFILCKQP